MRHTVLVVPPTGQDRVVVVPCGRGIVVALADGAGGTGGGHLAAQAVVDTVAARAAGEPAWVEVLEGLDADPRRLGMGQTTAVIVAVDPDGVRGASVGDSRALIVQPDDVVDLTRFQQRKPLLGSRAAIVTELADGPLAGRLVVGSDGLWSYAREADIVAAVRAEPLDALAQALVELVRRRAGTLPDDISIAIVE